ncbi:MAG: RNA polymerase sigma factor [Candidatus Delongbacteria bacterium]|jgi:RNA polymerase sigma-70 factor (ECF subfamily)|nr:RNA polymerase sigma factor [Candidatus Delongbacteria bacterium]
MIVSQLHEKDLIKKAQEGNSKAFERLIKNYDRRILDMLLNILKNEADAADAYQNTFMKVFKNLHSFKGNSSFYTWIYRIALNTAYTHYSKRKKVEGVFISEYIDDVIADDSSSEDIFGKIDKREAVRNEIEMLSVQQKSVVYMKSYEGKKFREIAEILSLNEGTVKKYFHRAVQKIKKNLDTKIQTVNCAFIKDKKI